MKILITGATGFIGRHLWRKLKELKYDITGASLKGGEINNDKIYSLDIADEKAVRKFFLKKKFDIVFHLATARIKNNNLEAAQKYILVNELGTLNILEQLKNMEGCKIVYASTIEIYGPRDNVSIVSENDIPEPKSFYAISKLVGEYFCKKYFDEFNIPFICLRLASVYGKYQAPISLIPIVIEKIKNNEDIIVYGEGKGCFDFVFVEDVIDTIITAGTSSEIGVFNIGSGSTLSVKKLCENIINTWASQSKIIFDNTKTERCYNIQLDIERAKQKLNYSPRYQIEDGLTKLKR